MSKVGAISAAAAPAPVSGGRPASAARDVTPYTTAAPIEGTAPGNQIAYNNAGNPFQDTAGHGAGQGHGGGGTVPDRLGLVTPGDSDGFAALLADRMTRDDWPQATAGMGEASFGMMRTRAIAIYESNSRAIVGSYDERGSSLNVRL